MNINQLSAIAKILTASPNEAKALIKLASVDILKALDSGKYSVLLENKTLTAQSDKPLKEGLSYWSQLSQTKADGVKLSNLLQMPQMLKNFQNTQSDFTLRELQTLLSSTKPESSLKNTLLENLSNASSKDEFVNNSNLLLSLQNNTFTIPITFNNYFSILQFKKRYNKKTKKSQIDFYAALESLGPISGVISLENSDVNINLNVAFDKTKNFLENDMKNLSYNLNISVIDSIEPLYTPNINSLLDVSI